MGKPSKVRVTGPLEPFAEGFRRELARLGYRPNAACSQLQLMAHLSRWMDSNVVAAVELTTARVNDFLAHRRGEGYTLWLSPKALAPLLEYLRTLGTVPAVTATGPVSEIDGLLADYESFLVSERGLTEGTITGYLHVARLFLAARATATNDGVALEQLAASEITGFVLSECSSRSVGSAKFVVCGLRSLLRWALVTGLVATELDAAVPSVSGWRLSGVPVSFGPDEIARLLASCDRRSRFGRRDYAALCLLARLGMRSGEVAALELSDIDWHAGEIAVRGKGPRVERLPLPVDVGDAIAGWVQRGRPRCESSAVITRVRAPHGPLTSGGVSNIVASACRRAGLPVAHAHRLRHAAATGMLQAGGSLAEVGQVLRHTSALTTAIYAKVDYDRLAGLARPWPQVVAS
jgi:integrase/recombinase XerD